MKWYKDKNIIPMLLSEQTDSFDDPQFLFEIKFDGSRTIGYIEKDKTTLINKRGKNVTFQFPELANLHQHFKKKVIVDGEIVVFSHIRPDFFLLQKRAHLTSPSKIENASIAYPATFVIFDILVYDNKSLFTTPLLERKKYLEGLFTQTANLILSNYLLTYGNKMFEFALNHQLEGVIAKKIDSLYYPNTRTKQWIKLKVLSEEDFLILGYIVKDNHGYDLIVGEIIDKKIRYVSKVATSQKKVENQKFTLIKKGYFSYPKAKVQWVKLEYIATIKYMLKTKSGHLRQPVLKAIRDDKFASDYLKDYLL